MGLMLLAGFACSSQFWRTVILAGTAVFPLFLGPLWFGGGDMLFDLLMKPAGIKHLGKLFVPVFTGLFMLSVLAASVAGLKLSAMAFSRFDRAVSGRTEELLTAVDGLWKAQDGSYRVYLKKRPHHWSSSGMDTLVVTDLRKGICRQHKYLDAFENSRGLTYFHFSPNPRHSTPEGEMMITVVATNKIVLEVGLGQPCTLVKASSDFKIVGNPSETSADIMAAIAESISDKVNDVYFNRDSDGRFQWLVDVGMERERVSNGWDAQDVLKPGIEAELRIHELVTALFNVNSMVKEVRITERAVADNGEARLVMSWDPRSGYGVIEDTASGKAIRHKTTTKRTFKF